MAKERYGFASIFDKNGNHLGYLKCVYKSKVDYVKKWLTYQSYNFDGWHHFVLWIDGQNEGTYYR
jgi:hypothetical protein